MKKSILYITLLYSLSALSQNLKVSVDKNPAIIGEQVLIQFTINGKAEDFQSPKFPGFRILSGPNPSTSSSYSYINGKSESTQSTTYSFYLKANKLGTHTISPAKVTIKGKTINSESININIVEASKKQESRDKNLENNLFIKATTTKRNIYQGEQIMVIYKLYTRIEISNTELSRLPSLNGFWNKDLETSSRFKREIIDGVAYNVATIKKTVLTAQKTGELIIDPMEVKCSIRIQSQQNRRDPFANFFGNYNIKEEFIKSKPIIIQVKELPSPKPIDFDGLVGDMNLQTTINKTTVAANDAINYTIKLIGTGNIELAKPFDIKFPSDFEVYDPKMSEKIFEGGRKRSIKTFEYVLIPRFEGSYNIPETSSSIFNPITKDYRTIKSKSFEIDVKKGKINMNDLNCKECDVLVLNCSEDATAVTCCDCVNESINNLNGVS